MISSLALVAFTAVLFQSHAVHADSQTLQGCFSSLTGLTYNSTGNFNSRGYCGTDRCLPLGYTVFGMGNSSMCYCGNELPPADKEVDSTLCTIPCPGYPSDICGGGTGYVSVYLTGLTTAANNAADSSADKSSSSSSSSSGSGSGSGSGTTTATSSSPASVVTVGGQTVVVTAGTTPETSSSTSTSAAKKSSSSSTVGVAVGVVVGLTAAASIAGGGYFFIRNRRRRQVEEEYRRNAAVSSFIAGNDKHPTHSSGGASSFADLRLDPVMAQRRMSDGSIADNQDYSRRILKVTNA